MHTYLKYLVSVFVMIAPCLVPDISAAAGGHGITADELKLMPVFCRYLSPGNYDATAQNMRIEGRKLPNIHSHHFCHGLKELIRGNRAAGRNDKYDMQAKLGQALGDFDYVQRYVDARDPMKPIATLYKGKVLDQLGRTSEAFAEYQNAIKLNPKLAEAYSHLANHFLRMGNREDARRTLEIGLKHSPNSKALQRKLAEMRKN
jgi:tetratricopeptide (TPR) repeat protein